VTRRDVGVIAVSVLASLISIGSALYTAGLNRGMRTAMTWQWLYDDEHALRQRCEAQQGKR
jgi:hypothetical protein